MNKDILVQQTIENIQKLPSSKIEEVADFVSFLLTKIDDQLITEGIQKMANHSNSFQFLEHEPELYTLNDLQISYK